MNSKGPCGRVWLQIVEAYMPGTGVGCASPDKPQVGPLTQSTPGPASQEGASPSRREVVTSLPLEETSSKSER